MTSFGRPRAHQVLAVISTAALALGAPALCGFEPCAFRKDPPMVLLSAYSSKDILSWHDGSRSQCAGDCVPEKCTILTSL